MYHKGVTGEKEDMKFRISLEVSFIEGLKVTVWGNVNFKLKIISRKGNLKGLRF